MIKHLKKSEIPALRQVLLEDQNNVCPICKQEIKNPVLDHEHKKRIKGSGLIRGVICSSCNVFLGKIENNSARYGFSLHELPDILRNIADYLENPPCEEKILHPTEIPKKKLKKSSYNKLLRKSRVKVPDYTGRLTKRLEELFNKYDLVPEFY